MTKLKSKYRTHTCEELRKSHSGEEVVLSGWIHRMRNHGGVVFVDLRDNYGITQVVFNEATRGAVQDERLETVIGVRGIVKQRGEGLVNANLATGEIEVQATSLEVHSRADVLPFQIAEDDNSPEATRLKFRFLDLRRERVHKNVLLRSAVVAETRKIMQEMGFFEFQTPILTSSSPEGARDFIVPSRLHPGKFFALPQAPQQFKQLLMVAGFDRYFQIAPCFRDEDPRADRAPGEFYQLDLEMSFVEQEDVFKVLEKYFSTLFAKFSSWPQTPTPFTRIKYNDAIAKYGSDKPDLRIPLEIAKITPVFEATTFKVFRGVLDEGGDIHAVAVRNVEAPSRKYFDDLSDEFQKIHGQGVAYLIIEDAGVRGSIAKFVTPEEVSKLKETLGITKGVVFFGAGRGNKVLSILGKLRAKVGEDFGLREKNVWRFCWITDYPMYERNEVTGAIEFSHNPFSMPQGGLDALLNNNPIDVYAYQYDLVLNGLEMLSGAIRNHSPEIMYKAFEIAGYSKDDVDEKFGGMIRAFKFGAPPHGGAAPGIDRIVMLLAEEETLRDVIAFPKAQTGEDLLMGAPGTVSEKQLIEAHIQMRPKIKV